MIISSTPHMELEGIAVLRRLMPGTKTYMEFGSGGSTMLAGDAKVPLIISTESDEAFCKLLRDQFCPKFLRSLLISLHIDIGPTKSWGHPVSTDKADAWPQYAFRAWKIVAELNKQPDLILIDGRFRSACMLGCLLFGVPGVTVLFDDYVGRTYQDVVEQFVKPRELHGRMAEFQIPELEPNKIRAITLMLADVLTDPQ